MYIIGIDGGGTKTSFGLFYNYQLIDEIQKGTCHFLQVGYDGCASIIREGIDELVNKHHIKEYKIGIGMAGYGSDEKIRNNIKDALDQQIQNYTITSDIHIALLGALNGHEGICVIAGTGSIAMALNEGELRRTGGWGYQLGDEGSGYWIGKELLKEFTYQADDIKPKDEIYYSIMNYFHLEYPHQLISKIHSLENYRTEIAFLSQICNQLSIKNSICQNIIKEAAKHTAILAITLAKKYNQQPTITYYGGVFKSRLFEKTFKAELKDYIVIKPIHKPIFGAYYYVKKEGI